MSKLLARKIGGLMLCVLSGISFALMTSDYDDALGALILNCVCCWLAIWLFFELYPLSDEQYSWRILLGILKYGPLALYLFVVSFIIVHDLTYHRSCVVYADDYAPGLNILITSHLYLP